MQREPHEAAPGVHGGEPGEHSPKPCEIQRLPRRLLRKVVVQRYGSGWFAMIVGFDPKFFEPVFSQAFGSRDEALAEALAMARATGLPLITAETLSGGRGPGAAA
jgi:hypothetical protein